MAGKLDDFEDRINLIMNNIRSISNGWKNYFGAAYYTRVEIAIDDLQSEIEKLKQILKDDD